MRNRKQSGLEVLKSIARFLDVDVVELIVPTKKK